MRADKRINMTKLIHAFRNFTNAPKKECQPVAGVPKCSVGKILHVSCIAWIWLMLISAQVELRDVCKRQVALNSSCLVFH